MPIVVLCLFSFPRLAHPDGMAFKGRDQSSFSPIVPGEQRAAIFHREAIQKMVIAINFEADDEDSALWIFPVLGTPDRTKVDLLDSFPPFHGVDSREEAEDTIEQMLMWMRLTQFWTVLQEITRPILLGSKSGGSSVYMEMEKWGIQVEAITAESLEGLEIYLKQRHPGIRRDQLQTFSPYLSGEHVLIVARISSRQQLLKEFPSYSDRYNSSLGRSPCLSVEFHTDRPFYPLRPTSGYGSTEAPINLYVLGLVQPETTASLARDISISHHVQQGPLPAEFLPGTTNGEQEPYTRITIRTPAQNLTDDLWFFPTRPPDWSYGVWIDSLDSVAIFTMFPILVAGISYLAAGLSSLWLLGKWKGYAALGLYNLLSLAGLFLRVRFFPGERVKTLRGVRFITLFSLTFVLLTNLLNIALLLPLASSSIKAQTDLISCGGYFFILVFLIPVIALTSPTRK
jgi:hypothetical protein